MTAGTSLLRLGAWAALCAMGCSQGAGILGREKTASDDGGGRPGDTCPTTSPPVTIENQSTCAGRVVSPRFSSALCVCNDLRSASLSTRGFDSSQGPYQATLSSNSGAAVGVNGTFVSAGNTDVSGSLTVAGPQALQFAGVLTVKGDLRLGGNATALGATTVARDAWFAGNFIDYGVLVIAGRMVHTGTVTATVKYAPNDEPQTVTITPPCPCAPSELLDIGGLVTNARSDNDNKANGTSTTALAAISGKTTWTLPCGRTYLSQIAGTGDLTMNVNGLSALFIDGSINLKGNLTFVPTSGAELDVFVRRDLAVQGTMAFADKSRPAAGRVAVGGLVTNALISPFAGNLYAPLATVTIASDLEVWGSMFVGAFTSTTAASIVFDRDIVQVGTNCTAPAPPAGLCSQCEWCYGGAACIDGVCTACHTDNDCCGQAVCSNGACVPLVK